MKSFNFIFKFFIATSRFCITYEENKVKIYLINKQNWHLCIFVFCVMVSIRDHLVFIIGVLETLQQTNELTVVQLGKYIGLDMKKLKKHLDIMASLNIIAIYEKQKRIMVTFTGDLGIHKVGHFESMLNPGKGLSFTVQPNSLNMNITIRINNENSKIINVEKISMLTSPNSIPYYTKEFINKKITIKGKDTTTIVFPWNGKILPTVLLLLCSGNIRSIWSTEQELNENDQEIFDLTEPIAEYKKPIKNAFDKETVKAPAKERISRDGVNSMKPLKLLDFPKKKSKPNTEELTTENYKKKLMIDLHREYIQTLENIHCYDLRNHPVDIDYRSASASLKVEGLIEKRPSIIVNDKIILGHPNSKKLYEGRVIDVRECEIRVRFSRSPTEFVGYKLFYVSFKPSSTAIRRCYTTVNNLDNNLISSCLFPLHYKDNQFKIEKIDNFLIPEQRNLNKRQIQAVEYFLSVSKVGGNSWANVEKPSNHDNIIHQKFNPFYLIFGPPGTGKTHTAIEIILRILQRTRQRILVSCPSNTAADELAVRILNKHKLSNKGYLIRLNSYSRLPSGIPELLKKQHVCFNDVSCLEEFGNIRVVVTTCSTAWNLNAVPDLSFDYLFLDEIGQAHEPEALIPISFILNRNKNAKIALIGDPKQLGPVIQDKQGSLETSILERLFTKFPIYERNNEYESSGFYNPKFITKLVNNYRSHESIVSFPSQMFYNNELVAMKGKESSFLNWDYLPNKEHPIVFCNIVGEDKREASSPSWFNQEEIIHIVNYLLPNLFEHKSAGPFTVGIITPYHQQKMKMKLAIDKKMNTEQKKRIKIGSVEQFQGQEEDVIIISTVRSKKLEQIPVDVKASLGFIGSPKRLNVSITRAKQLLIIVGNGGLLKIDTETFGKFIEFCEKINVIKNGPLTEYNKPKEDAKPESDVSEEMPTPLNRDT